LLLLWLCNLLILSTSREYLNHQYQYQYQYQQYASTNTSTKLFFTAQLSTILPAVPTPSSHFEVILLQLATT
jgi:hypothetical protein